MQNSAINSDKVIQASPSIICKNVSKAYKLYPDRASRVKEAIHPLRKKLHLDFYAVKDVSFEVAKGETFGIIGKNGSGKSTLLQLICGILHPTSGSVSVHGRVSALLELGAGFNTEFTGIENVYLNGAILGLSREEIDARLDSILAFADIGDFVYQPVKTYSSGMYVRLAFSVMANIDPEVFIIDEALAVGDVHFVHRCMNRFRELQERGTTILFVSHDTSSIKRLCKRALWLHEGHVKGLGDAREVADLYLEHLFGIQENGSASDIDTEAVSSQSSSAVTYSETESPFSLRETTFPNFDKRYGSGEVICIGANLYDEKGEIVHEVDQDSKVVFRLTIKNISHHNKSSWSVGYILRDSKGLDIASTHTMIENCVLPRRNPGDTLTLRFIISIPTLYPGSYSLSTSVSIFENGEHKITDRIVNAVVFKISSQREMHVFMRLPTEVVVEE